MAASAAKSALQMIDDLIAEVKAAKPAGKRATSGGSAGAHAAAAAASSSSGLTGALGDDVAWFPTAPLGHTPYSWLGEDFTNGTLDPFMFPYPHPTAYSTAANGVEHKQAAPAPAPAAAAVVGEESHKAPHKKGGKDDKKHHERNQNQVQSSGKDEQPAAKDAKGKDAKGGGGADGMSKKAAEKAKEAAAAAAAAEEEAAQAGTPLIARLDVRVGHVLSAVEHPNPKAERLYVEKIDVGEAAPRQIVSGLRKNIPLSEMNGTQLLVICNLQPGNFMGETSFGMVLAASNADKSVVELVKPPAGAKPGDRVTVDGIDVSKFRTDKEIDGRAKGSVWARVAEKLATNDEGVAVFDGKPLAVSGTSGPCKVKSLTNAKIA